MATQRRDIDRRLYVPAGAKPGVKVPVMAGFNLKLNAEDRKLPRNLRRVLAGVRRPVRGREWFELAAHDATLPGGRS